MQIFDRRFLRDIFFFLLGSGVTVAVTYVVYSFI